MRNQSQASSKQCESLLWYTRGRGYSRLPSYWLVQINKSSVVSGFPKQSESFGTDSTAKQTHNDRKIQHNILERLNVFIPYLHSKSPKYPCRTKRSWLWLLSRKWERHNRYTRMHCGHKRGDCFYSGSSKYKLSIFSQNATRPSVLFVIKQFPTMDSTVSSKAIFQLNEFWQRN